MPFVKVNIKEEVEEIKKTDERFKKAYEKINQEYEVNKANIKNKGVENSFTPE